MHKQDEFDAIDWLNKHTLYAAKTSDTRLTRPNTQHALDFLLMWSLFEEKLCSKNCDIRALENEVKQLQGAGKLQEKDFKPYLDYFVERFITEGQANRVRELFPRNEDRKPFVEKVLLGQVTDIYSIVLALLIIVYRYRNNIFHGEKAIDELRLQPDNIKKASSLLALVLDLSGKMDTPDSHRAASHSV